MHLAQMRAEAQAREDATRQERAARGEAPGGAREAAEVVKAEPALVEQEAAQPKPVAMPSVEPRPAPAQPVQPRPVAQQPEAPRVDPREILESAGLQMVETRADRVSAPVQAEEAVPLGRPRRERSRPAGEEPLVQIETKQ